MGKSVHGTPILETGNGELGRIILKDVESKYSINIALKLKANPDLSKLPPPNPIFYLSLVHNSGFLAICSHPSLERFPIFW